MVGFITIPTKTQSQSTHYSGPYCNSMEYGISCELTTELSSALVVRMQQHLSRLRSRQERHPVVHSLSRQNHPADQLWCEVNQLSSQKIDMEVIDMTNVTTKFSTSWVTINVITPAVQTFVSAWNAHRIPGGRGGIPTLLAVSANTTILQVLVKAPLRVQSFP